MIYYGIYSEENEEKQIDHALDIIRFARLYTPGSGIISRMVRVRREYRFEKIVIAYAKNEYGDFYAIGCALTDHKTANPSWTTYDANLPNEYMRINVWVKPKFRRKGIGKFLMEKVDINDCIGVECFDTGTAAKKLYANLKNSRMT